MSDDTSFGCAGIGSADDASPRAGLPAIPYRAGDFSSFRLALLQGRESERELRGYRPLAEGDYALQLLEWWAYVADVLTFYNERIANASYIRTATLDGEVASLVGLLGYRRRPGIGARALLGALVRGPHSTLLLASLAVQSKPAPGQEPQTFEVDDPTNVAPGGALMVDPVVKTNVAGLGSLLVRGAVSSIKPGTELLLTRRAEPKKPSGSASTIASVSQQVAVEEAGGKLDDKELALSVGAGASATLLSVHAVAQEKDLRGRVRTRLTLDAALPKSLLGSIEEYELLSSRAKVGLFKYEGIDAVIEGSDLNLPSPARSLAAGDWVLVEAADGPVVAIISRYAEKLLPEKDSGKASATVLTPRAILTLHPLGTAKLPKNPTRLRADFRSVGTLVDDDPSSPLTGASLSLTVAPPARSSLEVGAKVLVEDATLRGALATVTHATGSSLEVAAQNGASFSLVPPLRLLTNLVAVSRGATVSRESLGSGDASVAGQAFVLKKSPLTYFQGPGGALESTLRVWVNDVEWLEAPSFYGQAPGARCFVTHQDDEQRTHVLFGDGIEGARLPSGRSNVVASYRYGSGALAPDAGALVNLLKPVRGLQAVRNPVAASGGADPVAGSELRHYAPRSALALGRAVSADDYEAIAGLAPGVSRARAELVWDEEHARAVVTVWVSGDSSAVDSATAALRGVTEPNQPCRVLPAVPLPILLALTVVRDERHVKAVVDAALRTALLDPTTGLFSTANTPIGRSLYRSRLYQVCLGVPGVLAVRDVVLLAANGAPLARHDGRRALRYSPGSGSFFTLAERDLYLDRPLPARSLATPITRVTAR